MKQVPTPLVTEPVVLRLRPAPSASRLWWVVGAALVASGAAGLALNRSLAPALAEGRPEPQGTLLASASPMTPPGPHALSQASMPLPAAVRTVPALQFRPMTMIAPADPFRPDPVPSSSEPGEQAATGLPLAIKPAAVPLAAPRPARAEEPLPATVPAEDELLLVGIIEGDPALVVVKYDGRSFYLKLGEQVEDTWKLEKIGERSAVFSLGSKRAEIPLREGSSQ